MNRKMSMWLLPLGLGLNFRKVPFVTILLSSFIIGVFVYNIGSRSRIEVGMETAIEVSKIEVASKDLFAEYCSPRLETEKCDKYANQLFGEPTNDLVEVRKQEKELEKELIKSAFEDIGSLSEELEVVEEFLVELENPKSILSLASYGAYKVAREKRLDHLKQIYNSEKLLSKVSINPESVAMAQFRHAGFMHLFGNLLMFFIFGAYVEMRMGAGLFALTFFLGGVVGLLGHIIFFSNAETFIVGASANVSAVMGAFFVLFRKFRMKFSLMLFVFPIRSFYASVALMFPLMYVLGEVSSAVEAGLTSGGGVAHTAHLIGMGCGVLMGLIEKKNMPVDWPFITEDEVFETHNLKKYQHPRALVRAANELIKENPENAFARYYALKAVYGSEHSEEDKQAFEEWVKHHLDSFLAVFYRRNRWDELIEVFEMISIREPLESILVDSGQSTLLSVADSLVEKGNFVLALRFYDAYLMKYPRSGAKVQVLDTCERVFNSIKLSQDNIAFFENYLLKEKTELRKIIQPKLNFKKVS